MQNDKERFGGFDPCSASNASQEVSLDSTADSDSTPTIKVVEKQKVLL